MISCKIILS